MLARRLVYGEGRGYRPMSGRVQNGIVNHLVGLPRRGWVPRHQIVKKCRGTVSAINWALRQLVDRGDLERKPDPRDQRRRLYRLRRP